jgi:diguanylate cyclase (GGDEF)-like protein
VSLRNGGQPLKLLLVEDSASDALLTREWLREVATDAELSIEHVKTLGEALEFLSRQRWDCILLDLSLPDGSGGVQNVQRVRAAVRDVAIVVISGDDNSQTALEALRWGAQEYVVKGKFDGQSLLRAIQHALERHQVLSEIDRQSRNNYYNASHDSLTGLANRSLFLDRARETLAQAERRGERAALCFLDLDGFKPINDRHGHAFGDAVLKMVSNVLLAQVRESDTAARLGGDEFVALLAPVRGAEEAKKAAERIVEGVRSIRNLQGKTIELGASIGVALYPDHGLDFEALMVSADVAMYAAKRNRGGGVHVSTSVVAGSAGGDAAPLFTTQGLTVLFQPWLDLQRQRYSGVEALVRRREPDADTGLEIISHATQARSLEHLSDWVIERTAAQWRSWQNQNLAPGRLAINLSRSELAQANLVVRWTEILRRAGMPACCLQVEAAEHVFKDNGGPIGTNLKALRAMGVRVLIDNFGQEEASLTLMAKVAADGLKLDRSLVHALRSGAREPLAIAAAIVGIARSRNWEIIAVGVEGDEDLRNCEQAGLSVVQGFWFAEPLPARRLGTLLRGGPVQPLASNRGAGMRTA